jgi:hypothetical protein
MRNRGLVLIVRLAVALDNEGCPAKVVCDNDVERHGVDHNVLDFDLVDVDGVDQAHLAEDGMAVRFLLAVVKVFLAHVVKRLLVFIEQLLCTAGKAWGKDADLSWIC